jgi:hypothetical protein
MRLSRTHYLRRSLLHPMQHRLRGRSGARTRDFGASGGLPSRPVQTPLRAGRAAGDGRRLAAHRGHGDGSVLDML